MTISILQATSATYVITASQRAMRFATGDMAACSSASSESYNLVSGKAGATDSAREIAGLASFRRRAKFLHEKVLQDWQEDLLITGNALWIKSPGFVSCCSIGLHWTAHAIPGACSLSQQAAPDHGSNPSSSVDIVVQDRPCPDPRLHYQCPETIGEQTCA